MMNTRRNFLAGLATALLVGGCRRKTSTGEAAGIRIAVIPKGTTHEFWKSVHAGAVKAGREENLEILWKGPLTENDLKGQIDLVESFTAQRVSGIVLAPLDSRGLRTVVKNSTRSNVPVVIFDSALDSDDPKSFVATDNRAAGSLAGKHMVELLGGKGNVVVLRYQEGSASTHEREEGFLEVVRKAKGIEVTSDNQYAGATTETAHQASESLLMAQGASQGKIQGVFAPNESSTFGMLRALKEANLAGKLRFVGFDASKKLVAGLRDGTLDGLVVQNPFEMGYLSIKTIAKHLRGEQVDAVIDTGSTFVTKANLDEPRVKALIEPNLVEWLGEAG